ncbi:TetR family transcriptional regulator [Angustibacter speluncae]
MNSTRRATPPRDGRDRRWDDHRAQRRQALVEATLKAVRRHGSGAGMDEIAAVAGTSKTVLYRHFGDKGQLYVAVTEAVHALIAHDLRASVERAGATAPAGAGAREAVAAAVDAYLALVERDPDVYRFVVERPLLGGVQSPDGTDPVRGLVAMVAEQVAGTLEAAGVAPARATTWGHALVGMVRAAADHWIDSPAPAPRHELVDALVDLAWGGLAAAVPVTTEEPR